MIKTFTAPTVRLPNCNPSITLPVGTNDFATGMSRGSEMAADSARLLPRE